MGLSPSESRSRCRRGPGAWSGSEAQGRSWRGGRGLICEPLVPITRQLGQGHRSPEGAPSWAHQPLLCLCYVLYHYHVTPRHHSCHQPSEPGKHPKPQNSLMRSYPLTGQKRKGPSPLPLLWGGDETAQPRTNWFWKLVFRSWGYK